MVKECGRKEEGRHQDRDVHHQAQEQWQDGEWHQAADPASHAGTVGAFAILPFSGGGDSSATCQVRWGRNVIALEQLIPAGGMSHLQRERGQCSRPVLSLADNVAGGCNGYPGESSVRSSTACSGAQGWNQHCDGIWTHGFWQQHAEWEYPLKNSTNWPPSGWAEQEPGPVVGTAANQQEGCQAQLSAGSLQQQRRVIIGDAGDNVEVQDPWCINGTVDSHGAERQEAYAGGMLSQCLAIEANSGHECWPHCCWEAMPKAQQVQSLPDSAVVQSGQAQNDPLQAGRLE